VKPVHFLVFGIAAVCAVAVYGATSVAFVNDAYPQDRVRAEALNRCASGNTHFFRFSEHERDDCYAQVGLPAGATTAAAER
jgi:hypothetical protein